MLFRILGLSDQCLAQWSKVSGYMACIFGIACLITGVNTLNKSYEGKSIVLPHVKNISIDLNNLNIDNPNEKITIEYASKFMVSNTENFYRFWGYFGYICIVAGFIFLYQGAMYFKFNSMVNSTKHNRTNS